MRSFPRPSTRRRRAAAGWDPLAFLALEIAPWGLRRLLTWLSLRYRGGDSRGNGRAPPFVITENGVPALGDDRPTLADALDDREVWRVWVTSAWPSSLTQYFSRVDDARARLQARHSMIYPRHTHE